MPSHTAAPPTRRGRAVAVAALTVAGLAVPVLAPVTPATAAPATAATPAGPSAAYRWIGETLQITADEVLRKGARPTVISRQHGLVAAGIYDAWAAYDARAVGTVLGRTLRRPPRERTTANKEKAIAYAAYRMLLNLFPDAPDQATARAFLVAQGYDPDDASTDRRTPQGIGNRVAAALIADRRDDGANQYGTVAGSAGTPYSDYTGYAPVNTPDRIVDPDRWQPLAVPDGAGGTVVQKFLTPQWGRVRPFGLRSAAQFRPPPPPKVGSARLAADVAENVALNAGLTVAQKAEIEFMRDGPRSTAQSGHWLSFAQELSARDHYTLDQDVTLFFATGVTAMDAFIAAWEAKRFYDTSRPWTLVHHYYAGQTIRGWGGPGAGVVSLPGESWRPYSPPTFPTPAFPGYVSGHSTISAASAEVLKRVSGSDTYGGVERRTAGELTEPGFACADIMRVEGAPPPDPALSCAVTIRSATWSGLAELAGESRVLGGYHIRSDNEAGLRLGRQVAAWDWRVLTGYVTGRK